MPRTATPLSFALVSIEYPPDRFSAGIGSYIKTLATLLTNRGHRVHVVTRGAGRDSTVDEEGVTVHRLTPGRPDLPKRLGYRQLAALALRGVVNELRYRRKVAAFLGRLVEQEGIDLIEAADHLGEPSGYLPERHPRVPFVVRLHTPLTYHETIDPTVPELVRKLVGLYERRLLRRATHLTAPSLFSAGAFRDSMRLGQRPIEVYPNPPTFDLQPPPDRSIEDPFTVLFIGRITHLKGTHALVRALPIVAEAFPEVHLAMIGADTLPYRGFPTTTQYLRSLLPERYQDHLSFLGYMPHAELRDHYRRATVCVFPSLFESFGYTCLEAMSFGKAIVGSRNGGMLEMLDEGRAGRLYTPPNHEELANLIIELLGNAALRAKLGERARTRFATHYLPEPMLDQAIAFYRRAVAERAS